MCIEYDRTPIDTDTYLSLCLRPLNAFYFILWRRSKSSIHHGIRVVGGVKAISLAPLFCWADTISYFLSYEFHIIDRNGIFSLFYCDCCCCCFFVIFFAIFSLSVLLVSSLIVVSSVCFAMKNYIPHNNILYVLVVSNTVQLVRTAKNNILKKIVRTPAFSKQGTLFQNITY